MGATEEKIARFIVETSDRDIPAEARKSAGIGCFDCIGVMLAGVASPPGKIIAKFIEEAGGTPEITVVGTGLRTSPVLGALANGTLAHALDYDDGGGFGHCSCILMPSLISIGERAGASGKDILNAYVIGWTVGTAISSGCQYAQDESGFHATAIFGIMAAIAACARLLKLNVEQTITALGIAGSMPSGIVQNFGTYTKPLHAGLTDQNAVMACFLAQDGWKSTNSVFESRAGGFLSSYIGKDTYNLEAIRNSLDKRPLTVEIGIKKYPCCGANHSALDSILSLLNENSISFEDIERVDVDSVSSTHHILNYPEPAYGYQGRFSIHYNVATTMIDKRIDMDSYTDEKLHRPEFRQALKKVTVHSVPLYDPNYAPMHKSTPVTITLKDGRAFSRATTTTGMRGNRANPLTEGELFTKFKFNAALSLPKDTVDQACELWWNLEQMGNIGEGLKAVAGRSAAKT